MAGDCVKKIYYFYQTLLQGDSWLFQTATGFACGTLAVITVDMKTILTLFSIILLYGCRPTEVPKDFVFKMNFNNYDEYNSFDSTLTRSYNFGDTTLKVWLSTEEKVEVYKLILDNKFFDLPKSIPLDKSQPFTVPSDEDRIAVYINGQIKNYVKFNRGGVPLDKNMAKRFDNVYQLLEKLLTGKAEYKKLSPSNIMSM